MSFFKSKVRKLLQKTQDFLLTDDDSFDRLSDFRQKRSLKQFNSPPSRQIQDVNLKPSLSQNRNLSQIEVIDYRDNSKSIYEFKNSKRNTASIQNKKNSLSENLGVETQKKITNQKKINAQNIEILDRQSLETSQNSTLEMSNMSSPEEQKDQEKVIEGIQNPYISKPKEETFQKLENQAQEETKTLKTEKPISTEDVPKSDFNKESEPSSHPTAFQETINSSEINLSKDIEKSFKQSSFEHEQNPNLETLETTENSLETDFPKGKTEFSSEHKFEKQPVTQDLETLPKTSKYEIPIDVLKYSSNTRNNVEIIQETNETSQKIEETVKEYGIDCEVIHIERGPIITRYEIELPKGMKLNKLTSLEGELKVHLAALSVRIAPVIAKSTIGIEIPNKNRESLLLGDILRKYPSFFDRKDLSIPIGKDIAGKDRFIDLTKLPHLLVAGATGSGKSVCLNSMLSSLIYKMSPSEIQMVIIDPKMVELTLYQDIPHLMMPVITNPKHALKALNYLILEMEKRYQILSELKCRNLIDYNQKIELSYENTYISKKYKKFSYILIFIDELSDLMMVTGKELEDAITRITQKARAIGIHMVMATQRPSVDVITGLIKANCPARIAFSVAQKTDSQTILDQTGAETLLGQGDFLYRSPIASGLERIQSPYISEAEIEKIVTYAKKNSKPNYQIDFENEQDDFSSEISDKDESLVQEAWKVIKRDKKATGSHLQRKLSIGYPRAAKIIDILEQRGFIGPENGLKSRDIIK